MFSLQLKSWISWEQIEDIEERLEHLVQRPNWLLYLFVSFVSGTSRFVPSPCSRRRAQAPFQGAPASCRGSVSCSLQAFARPLAEGFLKVTWGIGPSWPQYVLYMSAAHAKVNGV